MTSSTQNPLQIALLHWYNANLTTPFSVGKVVPNGVAFDGANIWVANHGSKQCDQAAGERRQGARDLRRRSSPAGVAFDGANIWVANGGHNTVSKLRASDGAGSGPSLWEPFP